MEDHRAVVTQLVTTSRESYTVRIQHRLQGSREAGRQGSDESGATPTVRPSIRPCPSTVHVQTNTQTESVCAAERVSVRVKCGEASGTTGQMPGCRFDSLDRGPQPTSQPLLIPQAPRAQAAPDPHPPPAFLEARKGWDPGSRDETRAPPRRVTCEP